MNDPVARRRTRLSLGQRQTMQLLMALAYAIDTYDHEDSDIPSATVREWEALREVVRRQRMKARIR